MNASKSITFVGTCFFFFGSAMMQVQSTIALLFCGNARQCPFVIFRKKSTEKRFTSYRNIKKIIYRRYEEEVIQTLHGNFVLVDIDVRGRNKSRYVFVI